MKFGLNSRLKNWIDARDQGKHQFAPAFFAEATTFGERLRLLRNAAGLQQQDVAYATGTSQFRVSAWERKKPLPSEEELSAIAELFGVQLSVLMANIESGKR